MVVDYKKILQLDAAGVSQRGIADVLSCSRNTVRAALVAAKAAHVVYEDVAGMEPAAVREMLLPARLFESDRVAPDMDWVHREMARPNVNLQLLWSEYAVKTRDGGGLPYSYGRFCTLYRKWAQITGATMRIERKPGERIEVDWAGDTMKYIDPSSGAVTDAYVFVAVCTYSAFYYLEAFADMTQASWIDGHVSAFEAFGGVGRFLIPEYVPRNIFVLMRPP